jgi:hypothetical protein
MYCCFCGAGRNGFALIKINKSKRQFYVHEFLSKRKNTNMNSKEIIYDDNEPHPNDPPS